MQSNKNIWLVLALIIFNHAVWSQALTWLSQPQHDLRLVANSGVGAQKLSANGRYLTFVSDAGNLVADDTNYGDDVFIKDLVTGDVKRVTELSNGSEFEPAWSYQFSRASDDGRFVSFFSNASSLPMANGDYLLYLKDMQTGTLVADSVDTSGTQVFNVDTFFSKLEQSSDGRYVAFTSSDDVINNPGVTVNVFRKDRQNNTYQLVSVNHHGNSAGGARFQDMSANGRYLTFYSDEEVLISNPSPATPTGYLRDMDFANTVMFHVDSNSEAVLYSELLKSSVSNNGEVAFCSLSDALMAADNNGLSDVFVFDNGTTNRISLTPGQQQISDLGCYIYYINQQVEISDNGDVVAFIHGSNELTNEDNAARYQVYTHDRNSGQTQLISQSSGSVADQDVTTIAMNATGSRASLTTAATSLEHEFSTMIYKDIYLFNANNNELTGVPLASEPVSHLLADAHNPVLSADANLVLYSSQAPNADPFNEMDVQVGLYIYDRVTQSQSQLASFIKPHSHDMSDNGRYVVFVSDRFHPINTIELDGEYVFLFDQQTQQFSQIATGYDPKVNDDGQVVFTSASDDLSPQDDNDKDDVYLFNQGTQQLSLVSANLNNEAGNSLSYSPDIAGTGINTWLVFLSLASDLIAADDTPSGIDAFMINWPQGQIQRVSETAMGVGQNENVYQVAIAGNTQFITFTSFAQNLVATNYPDYSMQVYRYERQNGTFEIVSLNDSGEPHEGNFFSEHISISYSGRYLAYGTDGYFGADALQNVDGSVYLYDAMTGDNQRLSQQLNGDDLTQGARYGFVQADESVSPPLVSVVFEDKGELLNPRPNAAYKQVMLYQQGGAGVELDMQVTGSGSVSGNLGYFCQSDCSNTYDLGTTLNLLAIADEGATFLGWSGDACQDDNQSCGVTMNESKSIVAMFSSDDVIFANGFE